MVDKHQGGLLHGLRCCKYKRRFEDLRCVRLFWGGKPLAGLLSAEQVVVSGRVSVLSCPVFVAANINHLAASNHDIVVVVVLHGSVSLRASV